MESNNTSYRTKPRRSSFGLIFGIFMVIVYVGVGIFCIVDSQHDMLSFGNPTISLCLGILLIVYGIWRGYRLARPVS